jgi:hypothetical protein
MTDTRPMETRKLRIGFRTSIVTLFVAVVLLVGLTLVYLSFNRVSRITQTAASTFIDKVAQLGADRIDAKFRNVRDSLEILAGLPSIQVGGNRGQFAALWSDGVDAAQQSADLQPLCRLRGRFVPRDGRDRSREAGIPYQS